MVIFKRNFNISNRYIPVSKINFKTKFNLDIFMKLNCVIIIVVVIVIIIINKKRKFLFLFSKYKYI